MIRLIKILLGVTLILVVSLVLIVGITLMVFDPNKHKNLIVSRVEQATGRSFAISGNISLSYYPWLGLEAEGITLGNADGFGKEPMFQVDSIALRIKTLPLLKSHYVLDTFRLHGLKVNLARNKAGVNNWDDLAGAETKEKEHDAEERERPAPARREPLSLAAVVLGGVDVRNAQLRWDDQVSGQQVRISKINFKTGELIYGTPINLDLSLDTATNKPALNTALKLNGTLNYNQDTAIYAFKPINLKLRLTGKTVPGGSTDLTLKGAMEANLDKDTATVSGLTIDLLDAHVEAEVNASEVQSGLPRTEGRLLARGGDLAQILNILELPAGKDLSRLKERSFDVQLGFNSNMAEDTISIPDLQARLLGATIKGKLDARNLQSGQPAARGTLQASGQDLPALMQVAGQLQGRDSSLLEYGQRLSKAKEKTFSVVTGFDVDMGKGNILIDQLAIRALGITADGKLNASAITSSKGKMDGKFNLEGKGLSPLLAAVDQADLGEVLHSVNINAGLKGEKGEFDISPLTLKATFAGPKIPNSPVDVTLTADTRANLDSQRLKVSKLNLKGLGLDLSGDLEANNILDDPVFEGHLSLSEVNLRSLARQLNQRLPETADKKALGKVGMVTDFSGTRDSLALKGLKMMLDDTTVKGGLSVINFAQPDIEFDIKVDTIDADRYLPPERKGETRPVATPETGAAAASDLPLEMLRSLKVKGDLAIAKLVLSHARLQNIKLGMRARDGEIRLEPLKADLYDGAYDGVVDMDAKGDALKLVINTRLDNVNLDPLLKDYLQQKEAPLAGSANIALNDLKARGRNTDQIKKSITGKGSLNVKDGILRGVDIHKVLEQIEVMLESKRYAEVDSTGDTPFDKLDATLDINSGVITNKDLIMLARGFRVTGEGMLANLNDETIKYNLKVTVDETRTSRDEENYNIGGYGVPIQCRGSFSKPKCVPDTSEIAKGLIKKQGEDKLKGLLKKKLGLEDEKTETAPAEGTSTTEPAGTKQQQAAPKPEESAPAKSKEEQLKDTVEGVLKGLF